MPFIADAVPGWFQPVLALYDAQGKEVAYNDDYRYDPDPLIMFRVPKDGEYVMAINDAIFRGREDFVYRVTIGEMPFVTSIFPLGAQIGTSPPIAMKGWNLDGARLSSPPADARAGVYHPQGDERDGRESNGIPFALDTLPECLETEPNNDPEHAQKVELPVIINGRIDRPGRLGRVRVHRARRRNDRRRGQGAAARFPAGQRVEAHRRPRQAAGDQRRLRRPGGRNEHALRRFLSYGQTARRRQVLRPPGRHDPQRRRGICLPSADQRAAAGFRVAGGAVERLSAAGEQQYR